MPDADPDRHAPWLAIAAWAVCAATWRLQRDVRFFALSLDDIFRTQHVLHVVGGDPLPSDLWPPLPAWLAAVLVGVGVPAWSAPGLVNFAATVLALALVADTARVLGLSVVARTAGVVIAATLPWTLWLGWSALSEPIAAAAHLAVLRGLATWRAASSRWLVAAGLCLGGATRFEAWGDFAVVLVLAWTVRRDVDLRLAVLPALFPLAWLGLQAHRAGNPFDFAMAAASALANDPDTPRGLALAHRVGAHVWQSLDLLVLVGIAGWWILRTRPQARAPLIFGGVTFGLQAVVELAGLSGSHTWPRHYLSHGLFLGVAAGVLAERVRPSTAVFALVAIVALRTMTGSYLRPPQEVDSHFEAVIDAVREARATRPGSVLVELEEFQAMAAPILLDDPKVLWDRESPTEDPRQGRSMLTHDAGTLGRTIREEKVRYLVTRTKSAAMSARAVGTEIRRAGTYAAFAVDR